MRILGIDPGIAIVGWGVIDYERSSLRAVDYGSITTTPDMSIENRIAAVYHGMQHLFSTYHPDAMSVEELFFNTNQKTGIIVAEARGVILLSAVEAGVPIAEYPPLQIKQSVVGTGAADKRQVTYMVRNVLALDHDPKPDHCADALAAAVCHANLSRTFAASAAQGGEASRRLAATRAGLTASSEHDRRVGA